jgi:ketosteroid isomerase-like protein
MTGRLAAATARGKLSHSLHQERQVCGTRWLALTLPVLAACAAKETPEQMEARMRAESDSARAAIEAIGLNMQRWVQGGHADSMASIYMEDARMYMANEPLIEGREAIRRRFEQFFEAGSWTFTPRILGVVANGPLAVERGTYVVGFTPGPNAPPGMAEMFPDSGKYVIHWHRVDGQWMVADDIGNSNRQMPMPQPAGRRRS